MGLGISKLGGRRLTPVGEGRLRQTTAHTRSKKAEIPEYQRVMAGGGVVRVEFGLRAAPCVYIHNPLTAIFSPFCLKTVNISPTRKLMRGFFVDSGPGGGLSKPRRPELAA